jgi:adenine-specific DNA-methyltransferase
MDRAIELGQVYTSEKIARLMVDLIKSYVDAESSCLDPCIGKNIFFSQMADLGLKKMVGIEIDHDQIDDHIRSFYSRPDRELIIGDFFDMPMDEKFDVVIMNPPYIRQESIGSINKQKAEIAVLSRVDDIGFDKRSNLYVYFLIKALKHLKTGGHLVAIVYDSWLYTDYGRNLRSYIVRNYNIEKVIHFKIGAFDNILVGATVILISAKSQTANIEFHFYDSPDELSPDHFLSHKMSSKINVYEFIDFRNADMGDIKFPDSLFRKISDISEPPIRRGTGTLFNDFFIFGDKVFDRHTVEIIKTVSKIKRFMVLDEFDYILSYDSNNTDKRVEDYLKDIASMVRKEPDRYMALSKRIKDSRHWYVIKPPRGGDIIFNYYMRDNIHFIYNPYHITTSDNFYNIYVGDDRYENFCILNSSLTRYALLKFSRSQGSGLFKIQLAQFKDIPIMDVKRMDMDSRKSLRELAFELFGLERRYPDDIISEIDKIMIEEYNKVMDDKIDEGKIRENIEYIKGGR